MYPEPATFDPDRWADDGSTLTQRPSFVPFGGGRRQCIGDVFALTELAVVLATIAQRWRLRLVPGHPVATRPIITLRPRYGMRMIVERRETGDGRRETGDG